jgi:MFS superfamily sulfate permease-like transporter
LSTLVKLISDSVLVGFKAGAGLTIAMTQLPPPRSAVTLDVDQAGKRLR